MFGHKVDSKIYPQCSQSNGSRLGNSLTLKNKKNRCQGSISKTTEIQLRKVDSIESDSLKLVDRKLSAFSTTLRKYIVTRNRK